MKEKIKLSYDAFIAFLQGKEIHLLKGDDEIIIASPFDGLFLTHNQIEQIKYSSQMELFNLIQKIYESSKEHYAADVEVIDE